MRKTLWIALGMCLVFSIAVIGCEKKAATSQEAIETSKGLKTVDEQVKYLVSQANAFINGKEFDQAIATAQHVLSNLDQNSAEAKSILDKATEEMKKVAQGAMDDMKKKLGTLGQ